MKLGKVDCRKQLQQTLRSPEETYHPTVDDVEEWFHIINTTVFDRKLTDISCFEIKRQRGRLAEYIYWPSLVEYETTKLVMHNRFRSKQLFINVLAHEMVHHYQYLYKVGKTRDCKMNSDWHGKSFKEWKSKFEQKGLSLSEEYYNGK